MAQICGASLRPPLRSRSRRGAFRFPRHNRRKFGVRSLAKNVAFTKINLAAPAVERQPVAFAKGLPGDSCAPALCINGQSRTADQANLPELTCHDRCMGGASADGSEDSRGEVEAQEVIG